MAVRAIATADGMFELISRARVVYGPAVASRKIASGIKRAHVRP
jgi:hypothetical protein